MVLIAKATRTTFVLSKHNPALDLIFNRIESE